MLSAKYRTKYFASIRGGGKKLCKRTPFPWKDVFVQKSPFRTRKRAKQALQSYQMQKKIGFTAQSSLKSMGKIPRSSGCFELGEKYKQLAL